MINVLLTTPVFGNADESNGHHSIPDGALEQVESIKTRAMAWSIHGY